MLAAVEDVEGGHGKGSRVDPAQVLIQRDPQLVGGGLGHAQRDPQNRVRAEVRLERGPVQGQHEVVDGPLLESGDPGLDQLRPDDLVDVPDRLEDALSIVSVVAVPELQCLVGPGRRARGDGGPAEAAAGPDVYFHGGVSSRVQNLASVNVLDLK